MLSRLSGLRNDGTAANPTSKSATRPKWIFGLRAMTAPTPLESGIAFAREVTRQLHIAARAETRQPGCPQPAIRILARRLRQLMPQPALSRGCGEGLSQRTRAFYDKVDHIRR